MLHEYYHLLAQWNTGDLTVGKYLWEAPKDGYRRENFEITAHRFASGRFAHFAKLRGER